MAKPTYRSYSRYSREATELLGLMIHNARMEQKVTVAEVAERAGVSRGLVHRVEKGDMGCSIGSAFQIAAIVGVRLFESEPSTLTRYLSLERDKATLLPKAARIATGPVKDGF